jgi:ABC-type Fe3+-hydroxamate transport system substrate-binding protein
MYIKYTGTLDSACTITIGPNTLKRVHIIENATSGSQNIIIKQGSGNEVTIVPNEKRIVYLDGAGSGAAVQDAGISSSAATTGKAIAMAMVFG